MNTNSKNCIIIARLDADDKLLVLKLCRARGETLGSFVRRCIKSELGRLGYLPLNSMEALGLSFTGSAACVLPGRVVESDPFCPECSPKGYGPSDSGATRREPTNLEQVVGEK